MPVCSCSFTLTRACRDASGLVSFFNENSFWYYTDREFARRVPQITCRFQVSRLVTYYPDAWHEQHEVPYVCANLIAVKDGPRQGGILSI